MRLCRHFIGGLRVYSPNGRLLTVLPADSFRESRFERRMMSKKSEGKLRGAEKQKLQKLARRKIGRPVGGWLNVNRDQLFEIVAARLGVAAPVGPSAGYDLLRRYVGDTAIPFAPRPVRPSVVPAVVKRGSRVDVNSDEFLSGYAWRSLRMEVLTKYGARCQCCGATPADGVRMHVDHIKPRRLFPALALDITNLQVLCEVCNHGKGNWDETDWRSGASVTTKTIQ